MHYDFCTLFDRNYLFRGLALHESLQLHVEDFTLWVLCMDDVVYQVLSKMRIPSVKLISLAQFEDEGLVQAKATRSQVEYCWTCTPSLPLYLLNEASGIEAVIYLDADLFFYGEPVSVEREMADGSIGIVEHRLSKAYEHVEEGSGIYNVAFMVFKNDPYARECLSWWRERCNEWCYARVEDGRYGDQKYLDDWPGRFARVVVLQDPGLGLAPWNLRSHRITLEGSRRLVDGDPLIFYHFHSFQILRKGARFRMVDPFYRLGRRNTEAVYGPYVASIKRAVETVRRVDPGYAYGFSSQPFGTRLVRPVLTAGMKFRRTASALKHANSRSRATREVASARDAVAVGGEDPPAGTSGAEGGTFLHLSTDRREAGKNGNAT